MGRGPPKKASTAQKQRRANERQVNEKPINSASYAAVVRRGLVATGPPASSTHAAEETREDYEGGRNNHQVPPPGESVPATLTIFLPHPLSCSCFNKSEET